MKKIIALVLAVMMIAAVCVGCGQSAKTDATEDTKTIVMATNAYFPPYEYYDGDKIVGIDVEIAEAVTADMGYTLEIVDIEFDSLITGVQTGKYDFSMAGMTVTDERKQSVDFSDSYASAKQVVIVKEGSEIKTVDDLFADGSTYKAGVQLATTGDIYASDDLGTDRVTEYQTGADAVTALQSGKVDCVIIDNEPAKAFVAANEGLTILETEYVQEDYAACFAKDSELLAPFNASLKKLTEDGTIQAIIDKYINDKTSASADEA